MSAESRKPEAQELELWERISTTEGLERAEVLEEFSQFASKKNDFKECLQLIDTSIDIFLWNSIQTGSGYFWTPPTIRAYRRWSPNIFKRNRFS